MPARQIHVTVPLEYEQYVVDALEALPQSKHVVSFEARSAVMVVCRAREKHVGRVLNRLEQLGCGTRFGTIDVLTLTMSKPRLDAGEGAGGAARKKRRRYAVKDRMAIEEVEDFIDSGLSHLSFDYLLQNACAAVIAGVGLLTNSSVLVVASMIVSALMVPMVACVWWQIQRRYEAAWKAFRTVVVGMVVVFAVGCACALAVVYTSHDVNKWATDQITQRGTASGLLVGVAVAVPSGVATGVAATQGQASALVGIGVAASLLPPLVASAIALVLGLVEHSRTGRHDNLDTSMYAMLLFLINWVLIHGFGYVTLLIKGIRPVQTSATPAPPGTALPDMAPYARTAGSAPSSVHTDDLSYLEAPPARVGVLGGPDTEPLRRPLLDD